MPHIAIHSIQCDALRLIRYLGIGSENSGAADLYAMAVGFNDILSRAEFHRDKSTAAPADQSVYQFDPGEIGAEVSVNRLEKLVAADMREAIGAEDWPKVEQLARWLVEVAKVAMHHESVAKMPQITAMVMRNYQSEAEAR